MTKMAPAANQFGRDVSAGIEEEPDGVITLEPELARLWKKAAPLLAVRDNDAHTLYALGLARTLLHAHPEADAAVVLPAMMLHDIGWSQVPPEDVLLAIAPGGGRPDLVLLHEKEGARLAAGILAEAGWDAACVPRILEIIDGHDSRREALSIEDAIVKDSDKTWRLSPHGIDTVMDWFGLDRGQAVRLCSQRVHGHLFTEEARTIARALSALESVTLWPERQALLSGR
ncbi:metal-dependent phosphohydrolase HD sub domain-containing protein [Arthrobacter crystallopoietes BAB-32]|uniref:Metal-dependent phosphohydrolase HD sub domain-containing protein n=1 Tax=Arthrobacter crystallopoietes BAB-32 TaxID=1246476 RepID=N1UZB0_9MICC|nr:HD domain-containing protein [Arthrobacter crystallopoietes]EMY33167.1 metal-dependent phosphohydrolase HD sub domain-containing protein [Arthrobacter crystallopoietes BAB-32]